MQCGMFDYIVMLCSGGKRREDWETGTGAGSAAESGGFVSS